MTKKKIKYTFQTIHFGTEIEEQNPKFEVNFNIFFSEKLCKILCEKIISEN